MHIRSLRPINFKPGLIYGFFQETIKSFKGIKKPLLFFSPHKNKQIY